MKKPRLKQRLKNAFDAFFDTETQEKKQFD